MNVLALQPFHGGSHRAFLDGWIARSRHQWTVLSLSPHHWKWRMRHSASTFAKRARELLSAGGKWDLVLCTDMLDLPSFRGLAPTEIGRLPTVVYFHENQLTYPVQESRERDLHYAFTNLITAAAADAVWFNSEFHRQEFLTSFERFVSRLPDHQPREALAAIEKRSAVQPPGVAESATDACRESGPLHILWAARWEFDKAPDVLFAALRLLAVKQPFRLSVLGESFRETPPCFEQARREFADQIEHFGFLPRDAYEHALAQADVFVSTAIHEFFGISAVEAIAAGLYPLLPDRLSYPELLQAEDSPLRQYLYAGDAETLAERLLELAVRKHQQQSLWNAGERKLVSAAVERFDWGRRAAAMDGALETIAFARQP